MTYTSSSEPTPYWLRLFAHFRLMLALAISLSGCAADAADSAEAEQTHAAEENAPYDDEDEQELLSVSHALSTVSFCWKNTYGRGVGTIPDACPGQQKNGALCYPHCASGYYGVGPVCWQACPAGYRDDGTACWLDTHIFGANNSACPWYDKCGLTFARGCSTCPSGYKNDGCTCRRDVQMFYKHTYGRGAGSVMSCNGSLQYDAGLCYTPCAPGSNGVGPVCWGACPAELPVACGAGCARSVLECAGEIITQITATTQAALNIGSMAASLGTSSAVSGLTRVALSAAEKAALKDRIKQQLREAGEILSEIALEQAAVAAVQAAAGEPFDYALLDPTGIAALVRAFHKPICSSAAVVNIARGMPAWQSSTGYDGSASRAVDGNTNGSYGSNSVTHTNFDSHAWWQVGFQRTRRVDQVVIYNRTDCCSERLSNFYVEVRNAANQRVARRDFSGVAGQRTVFDFGGVQGDSVVVQLLGTNALSLAEVEVYGH